MGLCFSDAILGVEVMIFFALPVIKETCWLQLFLLNFAICLNYGFIFLMCLQRFLTIRSYNFGTVAHFDRKKYLYVSGMIFLVFLIVLGANMLIPKEDIDQLTHCTSSSLYGERHAYFVVVGLGPTGILTILVVLLSSISSIHLWRIYFRKRKTRPISETVTNRNITFTEQSRSEHEQDFPEQTTSSIGWSNTLNKISVKHLDCKTQNEDTLKINIQPQNDEDTCKPNTKVIQTVAAIDTWTVHCSVSHEENQKSEKNSYSKQEYQHTNAN